MIANQEAMAEDEKPNALFMPHRCFNVEYLTIGDHCFSNVVDFRIANLPKLKSLMIGSFSFCKARPRSPEDARQFAHTEDRSFYIERCSELSVVSIGHRSFMQTVSCDIVNCMSLRTVQVQGRNREYSYQFEWCDHLTMENLPKLRIITLDGWGAFWNLPQFSLHDLPSLQKILIQGMCVMRKVESLTLKNLQQLQSVVIKAEGVLTAEDAEEGGTLTLSNLPRFKELEFGPGKRLHAPFYKTRVIRCGYLVDSDIVDSLVTQVHEVGCFYRQDDVEVTDDA